MRCCCCTVSQIASFEDARQCRFKGFGQSFSAEDAALTYHAELSLGVVVVARGVSTGATTKLALVTVKA
jgi:hypothetical protein